jgi:S1-C subfamily serine protease
MVGTRPQYNLVPAGPGFERALPPLRRGAVGRVWMIAPPEALGIRFTVVTPTAPSAPPRAAVATRASSPNTPPTATPSTPRAGTTPPTPPTPASAPTPPAPPMAVWSASVSGGAVSYFGGAQFRALDDDWRSVLGLKDGTVGVMVNEVAPGSAAAQSGLRVGDVITHVNDAAASSPFVVVRLLSVSSDARAALKVLRAREPRTLTMRWESR